LFAALALGLAATGALAQAWPTKPVTMIVPFPPGGSTDMIARAVLPKMQEKIGTFIVDNRAGAGGAIGAAAVKNAKPDGYTVLVSSLGPFVIGPHLLKGTSGYDPTKDFDYVTVAVQAPNIRAVRADSPYKTFADFMKFLKANPDKMTFASAGNGTSDHLTAELLWQETKTKGTHIPYKGGAPALTDLLGGQVDATFMNINTGMPHVKGGKIRALAITSDKRSPLMPELPTFGEAGLPGFVVYGWYGVVVPAGTPRDVIDRLNADIAAALAHPDVLKSLDAFGLDPADRNSPEAFGEFLRSEITRWAQVVKVSGAKVD